MARLRGRDDLGDMRGRLSGAFRSAGLASLHLRFFAATAERDRKDAAETLDHFYRAAGKLCARENEFNRRARPDPGAPSLMTHLRGPAHLAALREFSAAKENLLAVSPAVGQSIVRLVEKDIDVSARASFPPLPPRQ